MTPSPDPVRVIAHAKLNLTLAVLGRRPDGFHDLASVVLRIGLGDELVVSPAPAPWFPSGANDAGGSGARGERLVVREDPHCAVEDNLVLRAARLVRDGRAELPPLDLKLTKRIPVAAGLGGGSSDAAAALRSCAIAWHLSLGPGQQLDLAARLGSDVPFFASGVAAALVRGRGERIEPLPAPSGALGALIVVAGRKPGTGEVFAALRERDPTRARRRTTMAESMTRDLAERLRSGLSADELVVMAAELRDGNDLWPPAARLVPGAAALRDALERVLARPVLLSGAGPALVALYPSRREAADAAGQLASARSPADSATIIATDLSDPMPAWRTP